MTVSNLYAVILAGGSGTRLWPLSRELHPKQLMKVEDNYTLFQSAFIRLVNCIDDKNILGVTNTKLEPQVRIQLEELQEKFCRSSNYRLITEPECRGTAGAIALSAKFIEKLHKDRKAVEEPILVVVTSDNLISDDKAFYNALEEALKLAQNDYIVSFGAKTNRADVGLGYIKTKNNKKIKEISEVALKADEFIEKPNKETTEEFIKSAKYLYNTGILVSKTSVLLSEIKKHSPYIYEAIKKAKLSSQVPTIAFQDYKEIPETSIDYAILENTKKLAVIPMDCDWTDVGSWEAVYEISEKDEKGNCKMGKVVDLDSENSLIYSTSKLITTIGLKDTVVVETEDAILVCDRNRSQEVKNIVSELKEKYEDVVYENKTVYRPWGYYTVLNSGEGFLTKCICVNPGAKLSIQLHHHRQEHWAVIEGKALVLKGEDYFELEKGQSIDIAKEEKHSLQNPYETPLKIIEIQQGDILDENDIVRFEDMYGRV